MAPCEIWWLIEGKLPQGQQSENELSELHAFMTQHGLFKERNG